MHCHSCSGPRTSLKKLRKPVIRFVASSLALKSPRKRSATHARTIRICSIFSWIYLRWRNKVLPLNILRMRMGKGQSHFDSFFRPEFLVPINHLTPIQNMQSTRTIKDIYSYNEEASVHAIDFDVTWPATSSDGQTKLSTPLGEIHCHVKRSPHKYNVFVKVDWAVNSEKLELFKSCFLRTYDNECILLTKIKLNPKDKNFQHGQCQRPMSYFAI